MKHIKIVSLIIGMFIITSCSTLFGPEEPEGGFPVIHPGPSFPYDRYIEGNPNIDLRVYGGFYVWKGGNSWHVRLANIRGMPFQSFPIGPVFTGDIHIENGIVLNPRSLTIGPQSDVRFMMNDVFFRFEVRRDNIEGFDFQVQPMGIEYCATIDLRVDGIPVPEIVYLGSFMFNPNILPLTICVPRFGSVR